MLVAGDQECDPKCRGQRLNTKEIAVSCCFKFEVLVFVPFIADADNL